MLHNQPDTHRRGAVMVITLFAMLLLAALVFYVINLGRQANNRIVTQHSADAAAIGNAGFYARTLNQVARNNLGTVQLIASVNVLDSMPLSMAFALEDQIALRDGLAMQMATINGLPRVGSEMHAKLVVMQGVIDDGISQLDPANSLFSTQLDVREITFYNNPSGERGRFWAAMESMEQYSVLAMDQLGTLAQINADRAARINLNRADNETDAVVLPVVADLAIDYEYRNHPDAPRQTHFRDFERPVRHGLLPERVDDPVTNRGPFDTVYGWHYPWPPAGGTTTGINNGGTPISRGDTQDTGAPPPPWNPTHYNVEGYESWFWRHVGGHVTHGRPRYWMRRQASAKSRYLWDAAEIETFNDPEWIVGWNLSEPWFSDPNRVGEIVESAYVAIEIRSKYPAGHQSFMNDGTWQWYVPRNGVENPHVIRRNVPDPRTWGVDQVATSIWRDTWETFPVYADASIGITTQYDIQGNPILQPVYRVDHFIFIGINVGDEIEIRNPHNFSSMGDLPGPVMLNRDQVNTSAASRRQWLTQLAVVAHGDRAKVWPSRFRGGKPYSRVVGIAEVEIFNDHSFDLWTPMWQSKVKTVSEYEDWLDTIDQSVADGASTASMTTDELAMMADFLRSTESLAPAMLNH